MEYAEPKIKEAFDRLKRELGAPLLLRKINGRYYVYESHPQWDKVSKKVRSNQRYLGRIIEGGIYVPSTATYAVIEMQKTNGEPIQISAPDWQLDNKDGLVLKSLSMNGRMSLSKLASIINMSRSSVDYKLKKLEGQLGIKYTAEVDTEKLGYQWYYFTVKFEDTVPPVRDMKAALDAVPQVQLACTVKGDYDLLIFFLERGNSYAADLITEIRRLPVFSAGSSIWYQIPISITYGLIPLRDAFFETLKSRVKVGKRPISGIDDQLLKREYAVLREMSKNGLVEFTEIDKKYGFDVGRSRYSYYGLVESGTIKRVTISMDKLSKLRMDIISIVLKNTKVFFDHRAPYQYTVIEEIRAPSNRYALIADTGVPDGFILMLPVYKEGDREELEERFRAIKGMKLTSMIVSSVITGALCIRRFDNMYSKQYTDLVETHKLSPEKRLNY